MMAGFATVGFFILVWAATTVSQYLYWQRVRKLIRELASEHVGFLGTGMCRISFSRRVFVLILADPQGIITGCYQLKGLSPRPRLEAMPEMVGVHYNDALNHLKNKEYGDAFRQSIHAIESSR